jgi:hypothetical protein
MKTWSGIETRQVQQKSHKLDGKKRLPEVISRLEFRDGVNQLLRISPEPRAA